MHLRGISIGEADLNMLLHIHKSLFDLEAAAVEGAGDYAGECFGDYSS